MREKIWYELVDLKFGENYLIEYLSFQKSLRKGIQIITVIVSGSGVLGWKYFENYTWIAFLLILLMQTLLLIQNQLIRSEKEIEEISELRMMYTKYFGKIEKLWNDFHEDGMENKIASQYFFELRDIDWEKIQEKDTKLDIKKWNFLQKRANIETHDYLKKYHSHGKQK